MSFRNFSENAPQRWADRDRDICAAREKQQSGAVGNAPERPCLEEIDRPRKRDDPRQGGRRRRSSWISPGGSG
jgi:hypothetical protein